MTEKNLQKLIKEMNIKNVSSIKVENAGISKAGLFSYSGYVDNKKVKIYSCFSDKQADLRIKMIDYNFSCKFPLVLARRGKVLIDEWIEGETLSKLNNTLLKNKAKKVFAFMCECKNIDINNFDIESFDYLEYLKNRIENSGIDRFEKLYQDWCNRNINTELMLCHNDLSRDNIVFNKQTNDLYIVDNEMLGISKGWFISWKNSFMSQVGFSEDRYYQGISKSIIFETWILRKAGTELIGIKRNGGIK